MWLLFDPYQDPLRLYYGSDTRASGLLAGALTALYWRPWEHSRERKVALWLQVIGVLGLAGIVGLSASLSEFDSMLYQGGFLICDVVTILAIAALVDSRTVVARLLGVAPLRWIGKRSYGLYLWHWPIILYVGSGASLLEQGTTNLLLAIGFLVGVTELSYRVIEQPIRRHGLVSTIKIFQKERTIRHFFSLVPTIALTSVSLWAGFVLASSATPVSANTGIRNASTEIFVSPEECLEEKQLEDLELVCDVVVSDSVHPFTLIGDSVIHGATNELKAEKRFDITLLADTNRSFIFGLDMVQEMAAKRELPPVIVIHLGTNGPVSATLFDKMMRVLDKQELVLFINVRLRRRWEGKVNETLAEGVTRYPNAELLDWHAHSKGRDSWFRPDMTHLSQEGERVIVHLILEKLDEIERLASEKEPEICESSELFTEQNDD
jgi:hypothetical protein